MDGWDWTWIVGVVVIGGSFLLCLVDAIYNTAKRARARRRIEREARQGIGHLETYLRHHAWKQETGREDSL